MTDEDRSAEVALWQSLLSRVEATVAVTGEWDDETARATAEWQQTVGIVPADGLLDEATWAKAADALAFLETEKPEARRPLEVGDWGEDVRYAQRRLIAAGQRVTIDGRFSSPMARAVRAFRSRHDLPEGDVIDLAVWEALG